MKMYQRTYREEQNIKLLLDLKYPGGYFYRVEVMDMSLDWMRYNCWVAFEEWFMHVWRYKFLSFTSQLTWAGACLVGSSFISCLVIPRALRELSPVGQSQSLSLLQGVSWAAFWADTQVPACLSQAIPDQASCLQSLGLMFWDGTQKCLSAHWWNNDEWVLSRNHGCLSGQKQMTLPFYVTQCQGEWHLSQGQVSNRLSHSTSCVPKDLCTNWLIYNQLGELRVLNHAT